MQQIGSAPGAHVMKWRAAWGPKQDLCLGHKAMEQAESTNSDYYAVLNVSRDASQDDIRRAYHTLAAVAHPDKNAGDVTTASANFVRVQAAYEVRLPCSQHHAIA